MFRWDLVWQYLFLQDPDKLFLSATLDNCMDISIGPVYRRRVGIISRINAHVALPVSYVACKGLYLVLSR